MDDMDSADDNRPLSIDNMAYMVDSTDSIIDNFDSDVENIDCADDNIDTDHNGRIQYVNVPRTVHEEDDNGYSEYANVIVQ